jgi:hypothetical protein
MSSRTKDKPAKKQPTVSRAERLQSAIRRQAKELQDINARAEELSYSKDYEKYDPDAEPDYPDVEKSPTTNGRGAVTYLEQTRVALPEGLFKLPRAKNPPALNDVNSSPESCLLFFSPHLNTPESFIKVMKMTPEQFNEFIRDEEFSPLVRRAKELLRIANADIFAHKRLQVHPALFKEYIPLAKNVLVGKTAERYAKRQLYLARLRRRDARAARAEEKLRNMTPEQAAEYRREQLEKAGVENAAPEPKIVVPTAPDGTVVKDYIDPHARPTYVRPNRLRDIDAESAAPIPNEYLTKAQELARDQEAVRYHPQEPKVEELQPQVIVRKADVLKAQQNLNAPATAKTMQDAAAMAASPTLPTPAEMALVIDARRDDDDNPIEDSQLSQSSAKVSKTTLVGKSSEQILQLLESGQTDTATAVIYKTLLQSLVDVMPYLEGVIRQSKGKAGAYAYNAMISSIRELMTDIQQAQDRGRQGEILVERYILPAFLDIGMTMMQEYETIAQSLRRDPYIDDERLKGYDKLLHDGQVRFGAFLQTRLRNLREECRKFLQR